MSELYDIVFANGINKNALISIFCGGTGVRNLVSGLLRNNCKNFNLLLNAYDDGKSTGDIRRNFGILGPSDISKNITTLAESCN